MHLFFYLTFACTIFCSIGLATVLATKQARARSVRVLEVTRAGSDAEKKTAKSLETLLIRLLRGLRSRIGASDNPKLRERLLAAGFKRPQAAETYFAAQMLAPIAGILIGSFIPSNTLFAIFVLVILGYLFPESALDRIGAGGRRRRALVRAPAAEILHQPGLPDPGVAGDQHE